MGHARIPGAWVTFLWSGPGGTDSLGLLPGILRNWPGGRSGLSHGHWPHSDADVHNSVGHATDWRGHPRSRLWSAPCRRSHEHQVVGQAHLPLEHHAVRRRAWGLMGWCSVGQQEVPAMSVVIFSNGDPTLYWCIRPWFLVLGPRLAAQLSHSWHNLSMSLRECSQYCHYLIFSEIMLTPRCPPESRP
jgi:hypothetical protein